MKDTVVERDLLPDCSFAAVLERVSQGMGWRSFLDLASKDSLINWAFEIDAYTAVVGHAASLAPLNRHILTIAEKSYKLTAAVPVCRRRLSISTHASGKIKEQTGSAEQFAFITIRVEPNPRSQTIQLTIPRTDEIPDELHCPGLPEAILDGVCIASFGEDPARPIVGFRVTVVDGKWHDVDSSAGVFKRATCLAMAEILREQSVAK